MKNKGTAVESGERGDFGDKIDVTMCSVLHTGE